MPSCLCFTFDCILFVKIIDTVGEDEEGEGIVLQQYPWEGTDRDYKYEEVTDPTTLNLVLAQVLLEY